MDNLKIFQDVLNSEAKSLTRLAELANDKEIAKAVAVLEKLRSTGGKLVVCGVGKSGIIAQKISSTFASLGLTSIFLHPTEALHGDLGRVHVQDAIIFLSKSGTTEEILKLIPFLSLNKSSIIGLLGNIESPIAKECGAVLDCSVEREACINNQAPTNSSTAALAVGDALAVLFENLVGLSKENFAVNHPGGLLGKSLSLKVADLMIPKSECPVLTPQATLQEIILEMTSKNYGLCFIEEENNFKGIIVEGDIRRAFAKSDQALTHKASELMNSNPTSVTKDILAFDALKIMEEGSNKFNVLPVLESGQIVGLLRLHDLFKAGFTSLNK